MDGLREGFKSSRRMTATAFSPTYILKLWKPSKSVGQPVSNTSEPSVNLSSASQVSAMRSCLQSKAYKSSLGLAHALEGVYCNQNMKIFYIGIELLK